MIVENFDKFFNTDGTAKPISEGLNHTERDAWEKEREVIRQEAREILKDRLEVLREKRRQFTEQFLENPIPGALRKENCPFREERLEIKSILANLFRVDDKL